MTFIEGFDRYLLEETGMDSAQKSAKRRSEIACATFVAGKCTIVASFIVALMTLCGGCGATITVNILSSHSRYGQAIGGTNTQIRGQIEGGGSATATVPMP